MTDLFQDVCQDYLRSYKQRAGTFPSAEIARQAEYCALGAAAELKPGNRAFPVQSVRVDLAANFAKLETMLRQ